MTSERPGDTAQYRLRLGPKQDEILRLRHPTQAAVADNLYRAIVEQARQPAFYSECGVPDTPDGRYDMIVAHVVLVLRRLRRAHSETKDVAQALFDLMFADMDQNLREMGVGDLAVGKRVKAMAKAFYCRLVGYDFALSNEDDAGLQSALRRNLFRNATPTEAQVAAVSAYVRREAARFDDEPIDSLVAGRLRFGVAPNRTTENPDD
jgi:cytochrome b pre-mRNA-processing protein 3